MARIAGVDLPNAKRPRSGLTYIYGVGRTRSRSLLFRAGIDFDKKVRDLTEDEVNRVRQILEEEGAVEGRPPQGSLDEHQASLRWARTGTAAPPRPAGARPAHAYQRPHAQRTAPRNRCQPQEGYSKT